MPFILSGATGDGVCIKQRNGQGPFLRYRRTSNILITEADAAIDPGFQGVVERRMLELGCIFGIQDFLSGWFHGVPFDQIWRGNVLDFIAYGFYCKRVEDLTPEQLEPSEVYRRRLRGSLA
ncbi:hypothetical protein COCOBI_01-8710 [Coccomyxa sp. Obi]|nr:hypothetical protein COCOBI_01-8710 [Coccomyxa sp. Obi]